MRRGCARRRPGTRETDLLNPINTVEKVHAVVLSGGSAFGLEGGKRCHELAWKKGASALMSA